MTVPAILDVGGVDTEKAPKTLPQFSPSSLLPAVAVDDLYSGQLDLLYFILFLIYHDCNLEQQTIQQQLRDEKNELCGSRILSGVWMGRLIKPWNSTAVQDKLEC